jgi:hypothetical protein
MSKCLCSISRFFDSTFTFHVIKLLILVIYLRHILQKQESPVGWKTKWFLSYVSFVQLVI